MNNNPFVSIIIPVRNEKKYIGQCIENILKQTYPKNKMEILVIDGMSEDNTREIANRELQIANHKLGLGFKIIGNPKLQRAPGLNLGIKNAKGELIIRIDARTVIPENYIDKCVSTLFETNADNVGGVQKAIAKNPRQRAIALAMSHPFGVGDAQFRLGKKSGYVDSVYLGCFKKEIFKKVGLFDENAPVISEDSDINYRIRQSKGKVYLNKDIIAYYYPRNKLKDLWKLYFRYGGARAGNFYKHKTLRLRQIIPVAFLLIIIGLAVLMLANQYFSIPLAIILGLYFLTDLVVTISLAIKNKSTKIILTLLFVFPCMHFAWALGFLTRIIQGKKYKKCWGY